MKERATSDADLLQELALAAWQQELAVDVGGVYDHCARRYREERELAIASVVPAAVVYVVESEISEIFEMIQEPVTQRWGTVSR